MKMQSEVSRNEKSTYDTYITQKGPLDTKYMSTLLLQLFDNCSTAVKA